jgi:DNA-directed RNA polymerase subunit RPC12/RpoP
MANPPGNENKGGMTTRAIQAGKFDFKCTHCNARLNLDPGSKIVNCEYCGAQNVVPEKLWKMIAPQPPPPSTGISFSTPSAYPPTGPYPPVSTQSQPQPDYVPTPPVKRRSSVLPFILPLVIILFVGGTVLFTNLRSAGKLGKGGIPVYGEAAELVSAKAVTPSFESADPMKTAKALAAMVKKKWVRGAQLAQVSFNKLSTNGTINVSKDTDGSITLEFLDVAGYENRIPGESSVKNGKLLVHVMNGYLVASIQDASLSFFEHTVYLSKFPKCDIPDLIKAAQEAGYPSTGYVDVRFPELPTDFQESYFDMSFRYIKTDKKEIQLKEKELETLWKKVGDPKWQERYVTSYSYYVAGFDASKLPSLFRFKDCTSPEGDEFMAGIVKKYLY